MSISRYTLMLGSLRSVYNRWTVSFSCTPQIKNEHIRNMANSSTDWNLRFDNVALRTLAVDSNKENYVRQVSGAFFSVVKPVPVEKPQMVSYSESAAGLLDLQPSHMERSDAVEYFSGNKLFEGSEPAAHCYCGHQFGYFAGQLGDGAVMYLGEVVNRKGERWELQLKGAGPTPYSRDADGRKVLRSSIREYLCSEAMHHLNIPTTRAVSCVTSDSKVVRDIYYDGHPIMERCTIVSRLASTFLRFGSFEIFKTQEPISGRAGPSVGRKDLFDQLLDYTISSFYSTVYDSFSNDRRKMSAEFFKEVVIKTAHLVADWQCVGFCHGVLNTDNMSIVGLTIDYGPFGFMDHYNPDHICNGSDSGGRYSFANQPTICGWNLAKLAESLQSVLPLEDGRSILEDTYFVAFDERFLSQMKKKFGLIRKDLPEDRKLVEDFLDTMADTGSDFTNSFRGLNLILLPGSQEFDLSSEKLKSHLLKQCCTVDELRILYKPTMNESEFMVYATLLAQQPQLLEQLGKGADFVKKEFEKRKKFNTLKDLSAEVKMAKDEELWQLWIEKYKNRLLLEVDDDCDVEHLNSERIKVMNAINPRYVLRNYMVQVAIEAAEKGDFSEVQKLLKILENPFEDADIMASLETRKADVNTLETPEEEEDDNEATCDRRRIVAYDDLPPEWAKSLRVTCSS